MNYSYDSAGRLTNYEGMGYNSYRGHGVTNYNGSQQYYYDNNGNVVNRRWASGNNQTLIWDHENHLSGISGTNGYYENYLYDADGQRVKKSNGIGGVTFYPTSYSETTNETVWVDDAIPCNGASTGGEDGGTGKVGIQCRELPIAIHRRIAVYINITSMGQRKQ